MKDRWSQLSLRDKSDLMSLYIKKGVTSLDKMKEHYNSYAGGGSLDEPPFVKRFQEGQNRAISTPQGNATHKLSYAEFDGKYIVYPNVQPIDYNNPNSPLRDYEDDDWTAYDRAVRHNDTLQFNTAEEAEYYTRNYKNIPFTGATLNNKPSIALDFSKGRYYTTGGHLYKEGGSDDEKPYIPGSEQNYGYLRPVEIVANHPYRDTVYGNGKDVPEELKTYEGWQRYKNHVDKVRKRPDYEGINPMNIVEYMPLVGDAVDVGHSLYDLQQGRIGLGLASLGMIALPNIIEKPLKTINKAAVNLLDDIRYSKYKKNARHIANNAYTNHLKRVGLTRNDIGSTDYQHSEDITRDIIQQNNYDISTVDGRRQFLQDIGKLDNNATNEQVDNTFLKFLQLDNYNGNNKPGVYTFNNLKGQVMAVSDDAGMNFSRRKAAKGSNSNISLRNGQILDSFDWLNGNNESIKSHELTHYLQYKNNLIDGSRVNNIFDYNKFNNLSDKVKNYFTIDNGTEADARLSQILDFYNISNNKKIKPSHIRYVKNNYTGINNSMLSFLQALADDKKVADYINKNRKSKFLENGGKINT